MYLKIVKCVYKKCSLSIQKNLNVCIKNSYFFNISIATGLTVVHNIRVNLLFPAPLGRKLS